MLCCYQSSDSSPGVRATYLSHPRFDRSFDRALHVHASHAQLGHNLLHPVRRSMCQHDAHLHLFLRLPPWYSRL